MILSRRCINLCASLASSLQGETSDAGSYGIASRETPRIENASVHVLGPFCKCREGVDDLPQFCYRRCTMEVRENSSVEGGWRSSVH